MKKILWVVIVGLVLVGCGGAVGFEEPSTVEVAVLPPTGTFTPEVVESETSTINPTVTLIPSHTPNLTKTSAVENIPSATKQPTSTDLPPTITSTNQYVVLTYTPTPQPKLKAHEWVPKKDILISFETYCAECFYPPYIYDRLFLYANGLLIKESESDSSVFYYRYLDERKICKVMNTIDQAGFFDYDPSVYKTELGLARTTHLSVNAWGEISLGYKAIGLASHEKIYQEEIDRYFLFKDLGTYYYPPPIILPALRDTYTFINTLDLGGWKTYAPDRLILTLYLDKDRGDLKVWPFDANLFIDIFAEVDAGWRPTMILIQGEAINEWGGLLEKETLYTMGDNQMLLSSIIPILPHEDPTDYLPSDTDFDLEYGEPVPEVDLSVTESISCKVSDGVYDLP